MAPFLFHNDREFNFIHSVLTDRGQKKKDVETCPEVIALNSKMNFSKDGRNSLINYF